MQYAPTHIIVARHELPLCNTFFIGYQRINMCCIIYLQHPKSQRILNPLVMVLATPIWAFRYASMRWCKGGSVVYSDLCFSTMIIGWYIHGSEVQTIYSTGLKSAHNVRLVWCTGQGADRSCRVPCRRGWAAVTQTSLSLWTERIATYHTIYWVRKPMMLAATFSNIGTFWHM
jgi:hypothetical protein